MTTPTPPSTPTRSRRRLLTGLFAVLAAALALALAAPPVSAGGPGPVWENNWNGNGNPNSPGSDGVDGTWTGAPDYEGMANDRGFTFDGTNYVSGPPALGNMGSDDFRIDMVVRTSQTDAFTHDILSNRASCAGAPFWQVFVSNNGVFAEFRSTDGSPTTLLNPTPVNDGTMHQIIIERVGSTLSVTVDATTESTPIVGSGDFTTVDQHVSLGGGNPCVNVGNLRPFVGAVDRLFIDQGNDPQGQDLQLDQASTPTVPAGGSGSFVVYRENQSESQADSAHAVFTAPPGITFTSASDPNSTCSVVDASRIDCGEVAYGSGDNANPVTIGFTVDPSAAPGSTVNVTGDFSLLSNTDPDHANDQGIPLSINIAPQGGVPLADPIVAGGFIALVGLVLGTGMILRRRTQA